MEELYNFWSFDCSDFFSLLAITISVIAIIVSIKIASQQNKIALVNARVEILSKIENYVYSLSSWEYKYEWFLELSLSKIQLESIFNSRFVQYYEGLKKTPKQIEKLWGDYEYAKNHFECNGKSEDEIEVEIQTLAQAEEDKFKKIKDDMLSMYMKF